jgi:hypothetical protein
VPSEVICILPKEKEAQFMEIRTTATNRKDIAKAIAEYLGERSVYVGPPTFAYKIGDFTVDREGLILTEDETKGEEVRQMLEEKGFVESGTAEEENSRAADTENTTAVTVPLGNMAPQGIINLANMIHSKQYLINKSIGTDGFKVNDALITALEKSKFATAEEAVSFITEFGDYGRGFSFADGCICFSGFPYTEDGAKAKAYCELTAAMVRTAREQKRISPTETIEDNEKYYMRVWLVRLGFDGKECKETRKVLLENLKGHTAFRTEADKQKWNDRQKARKAAATASEGEVE